MTCYNDNSAGSLLITIVIAFSSVEFVPCASAGFLDIFPGRVTRWLNHETCSPPWVRGAEEATEQLRKSLNANLFGQHVAKKAILTTVGMHLKETSPKKATVISLHGWPGSGKTFSTQLIIEALFEKGEKSDYVQYYSATYHFPDPGKIVEYRERLKREVISTAEKCERALFVFDEVDKLPMGLLDELAPLIKSIGNLEKGVTVKKSLFIFLSNQGAHKINEITVNVKELEKNRESLDLRDFEEVLSNEAFSNSSTGTGGLYKSELIERILVDLFIPFLPLERQHVERCIERDARNLAERSAERNPRLASKDVVAIADRMSYWPAGKGWYSHSGCKRVENLVRFHLTSKAAGKSEL